MSDGSLKFGSAAMVGAQLSGLFGMGESTIIARVIFILLDDSEPDKFKKYNGWKGIGTIECVPYINGADESAVITAVPIDNQITRYPVKNELVFLKRGVSFKSQGGINNYSPEWYYTETLSTWNAVEHNATPNSLVLKNNASQTPYSEASIGLINKDTTEKELDITGKFKEKGTVKKLIKAPGDITIEGRSGSTVRFGSYIESFNSPIKGKDRSPLIMIVNSQRDTNNKNPIFEDVNKDGTSLYMLEGQTVNFLASSLNFDSFNVKIDTDIKSNYVEANVAVEVPVNQPAAVVDKKEIDKKEKIAPPVPVSNVTETKKTSDVQDDEIDLIPDKESDVMFVQEVEDVIDLDDSDNDDKEYKPDPKDIITNISSSSLYFNTNFEVQNNRIYCFIASATMLLRYLGSNVSQNQIGSRYVDSNKNLNFQKVANDYNKRLSRLNIPGGRAGYDFIINTIKSLNKPFILQRKGISSPSKSHFVLVVGLSSDGKIIVNDPRSSAGRNNILKISELKDSGGTLRILN